MMSILATPETGAPTPLGVLVVDDEPVILEQIAAALRRRGYDVTLAGSASEASEVVARRADIGVVVTDIRMPGQDGLTLARGLTGQDDASRPEVVFVTGHATIEDAASAVRIGAADFLRKPLRAAELATAVSAAMDRAVSRRRATVAPTTLQDSLTGLAGRADLVGRLLAPHAGPVGLILIDLDRFRLVNEALGMPAGDAILTATAQRASAAAAQDALVARFGDDEFAVLVEGHAGVAALPALAEALRLAVTQEIEGAGTRRTLTASVGYAAAWDGDGAACLHGAEAAVRTARGRGGNRTASLSEAEAEGALRRSRIATSLGTALSGSGYGIALAFQPVLRASDLAMLGFEALVRFNDPALGRCDPDEFLPVAEEFGLMGALGRRVMAMALEAAAHWRAAGLQFGRMAVNVAASELRDPAFTTTLAAMVAANGLEPGGLCLEVTEGEALPPEALPTLAALHQAGFGIAIDDFGVGHSSLARLRDLPATIVKFDRRFTERLPGTEPDRALLLGMVRLAGALGLATVAEGVETPAQLAALREVGVGACQGYLLGKPMPSDEVPGFLRRR
ncbi:EAL domain-containing protein [Roseomonas sp. JC162]|uniref:EAL domain-containing protein n=1 Tax=Neoroseomonas marina TaxID=1232220 RepID=A0A848EI20_9PROT|nr:EAL domain-containing protein [Neoroseomonas marina]NMJ44314.1 EAL domain-containing protein [Neoroseomonas marina]